MLRIEESKQWGGYVIAAYRFECGRQVRLGAYAGPFTDRLSAAVMLAKLEPLHNVTKVEVSA